jgi:hypothetical protein
MKLLGQGSFGKVYQVVAQNGKRIALKKGNHLKNQFLILEKLRYRHPNIINVFHSDRENSYYTMQGLFKDEGWITLVDLRDVSILDQRLPLLVDAVEWIHSQGIVHRDIKADNVMVNTMRNDLKLVDFGFACDSKTCKGLPGSLMYASPEILNLVMTTNPRNIELTREQVIQHDLWALGMTIYVCLIGRFPIQFYCNDEEETIRLLYEFYSQQILVPAVEYFGPLKIKMYKRSIPFRTEWEIEKTRREFLLTYPLNIRYRVDYKQYLRSEPRVIVNSVAKVEPLQEEDYDSYLQLKARKLERYTKIFHEKLFKQRQQDYVKKPVDELGLIRRLWRHNPTWDEFIAVECRREKVSTPRELFIILIQSKSKWDNFWEHMLTATRTRRQTFLSSVIRKTRKIPDSQANYRGGNVLAAKQALDSLIQN